MDRYEELARQATWVASKVSSDVHGVDTMVGHLAEGRFKIGAGDTAVMLEGIITPGKPLPGMVPIVTERGRRQVRRPVEGRQAARPRQDHPRGRRGRPRRRVGERRAQEVEPESGVLARTTAQVTELTYK